MNPVYTITRSYRSTIAIYVKNNGEIEVRAPHLVPKRFIDEFVRKKSGWIGKQQNKIRTQPKPSARYFRNGEPFLFLGTRHTLTIGSYREIAVHRDKLVFPSALLFRIRQEMPRWYKREAARIITERVRYYETIIKTTVGGIRFSDTLSKWGSCTQDNRLQFNWRLIMAPILVIDYVVVRELVHTRIKNHSHTFWSEVAKYKPAHRQYRRWLNDHARILQEQFG